MEADLLLLLVQFIRHRKATHDIKSHSCVTCEESDRIIGGLIEKYFDKKLIDETLEAINELAKSYNNVQLFTDEKINELRSIEN
jgi:hypothetical protein